LASGVASESFFGNSGNWGYDEKRAIYNYHGLICELVEPDLARLEAMITGRSARFYRAVRACSTPWPILAEQTYQAEVFMPWTPEQRQSSVAGLRPYLCVDVHLPYLT